MKNMSKLKLTLHFKIFNFCKIKLLYLKFKVIKIYYKNHQQGSNARINLKINKLKYNKLNKIIPVLKLTNILAIKIVRDHRF